MSGLLIITGQVGIDSFRYNLNSNLCRHKTADRGEGFSEELINNKITKITKNNRMIVLPSSNNM